MVFDLPHHVQLSNPSPYFLGHDGLAQPERLSRPLDGRDMHEEEDDNNPDFDDEFWDDGYTSNGVENTMNQSSSDEEDSDGEDVDAVVDSNPTTLSQSSF